MIHKPMLIPNRSVTSVSDICSVMSINKQTPNFLGVCNHSINNLLIAKNAPVLALNYQINKRREEFSAPRNDLYIFVTYHEHHLSRPSRAANPQNDIQILAP